MCRINDARTAVQQLTAAYPFDSDLQNADDNLELCLEELPDINLAVAFDDCLEAEADLAATSSLSTDALRDDLTLSIMRMTRRYLDEVAAWFGDLDPITLAVAEAFYADGETAYLSGSYDVAIQAFLDAVAEARPCNKVDEGLEGGGC